MEDYQDFLLSESGDVGEKFWKIREVIGNFRKELCNQRLFVNKKVTGNKYYIKKKLCTSFFLIVSIVLTR